MRSRNCVVAYAAHISIHCSVCGASFHNKLSFRHHYYRKHFKETNSETVDDDFIVPHYSTTEDGCSEEHSAERNKCDEAAFLLKFTAGHRISQNAVADIMVATKELFRCKFTCFQQAQHDVDNRECHAHAQFLPLHAI